MKSIKRAIAVLLALLVFPAAAWGQGASAEVSGDTLRITQDAGVGGTLKVVYIPARPDYPTPIYTVEMFNFGSEVPDTRSSTCSKPLFSKSVSCPAAGVTNIVIEAGDGDDEIGVGTQRYVNSGGSAPIPVPVSVSLGDGNDMTYFRLDRQTATVDGGNGNDSVSTANPDPFPKDDFTSGLRFIGGPGDDRIELSRRTGGETVFLGGDGQDAASGESNGVTTLNGEAGADRFGVKHAAGTLALLGGDGDDTFEMDDLDSAGSARTEVRAGPGNDTIEPRLGAGSDLIDCGSGSDSVELPEGNLRKLLLGHTYIDCPIVAAQFKNPRLSPRGARVAIALLPPARAKAKVAVKQVNARGKTVFRSPAVRVRFVRGRSSRVTLKVPKKLLRLRRARLYVIVDATSASGDRTRLEEKVLFKR